jgi:hypothetical protein
VGRIREEIADEILEFQGLVIIEFAEFGGEIFRETSAM